MKKFLFFLVVNFMFISVCFGQSITINSIGMHGEDGLNDFDVSPYENITLNVNYTVTGLVRPNKIQGYSFNGELGKIYLMLYSSVMPDEEYWVEDMVISLPINTNSQNGTFSITSTMDIESFSGVESIQAGLQLYTSNSVFSLAYSSYIEDSYYETSVPLNSPPVGYSNFLNVYHDNETTQPILITPNSQTDATYDNSSLDIRFQLAEVAMDSTVKLYFSTNPEGLSPVATLTLSNSYTNTEEYNFELDASNFNNSTQIISTVPENPALTHGVTYYVAIGYKDYLGNPEALSSWNKLEYDNKFDFFSYGTLPNDCWPNNFYSQNGNNITLTFNIEEPTAENKNIELQVWFNQSLSRRIELDYSFNTGLNSFTFRGDRIGESENFVNLLSGVDSLTSGSAYEYVIVLTDQVGNTGSSYNSVPAQFYYDTGIQIDAEFNEIGNTTFSNVEGFQDLAELTLTTPLGEESSLLSLKYSIDLGSVESDQVIAIKVETNNGRVLGTFPYSGPGSSNEIILPSQFPLILNQFGTTLSFQVKIQYPDNNLHGSDYISLSIAQEDIVVAGVIDSYYPNAPAVKYLKQCLIVDYRNLQPAITNNDRETAFFRLDLRTNDGTVDLLELNNFRVWGSIEGSDIVGDNELDKKIYLYESNSPTLVLPYQGNFQKTVTFGDGRSFDNLNRTISPITKYFYFTIRLADGFDPEHTILGSFEQDSDINIAPSLTNNIDGVFPLNSNIEEDYMTLPVELSSFTAIFHLTDGVGLTWVTESETNISGYHIYRNETNSFESSLRINPLLISNGIENGTQKIYSYLDDEVELKTDYYYWLQSLEYDGFSECYGPFSVYTDEDQIEDELEVDRPLTQLLSAYPNPFNPDVNIPYKLIENNSVEISIFNIKGQKVRSYFRDNQEPGNYSIYFDGRDDNGNRLSSGIYFYRMKTNTYSKTNKMILLK